MTRKEFLTLTFTLVGTTAAAAACSSDSNNSTGTAGTSGAHGGSGGGAAGTSGGGGTQGAAGTTGAGGTGAAAACTDPLPEMQAASDHTHHVVIAASTLNMTTAQTINTDVQLAHMHSVTLEPGDLATLKGGGMVMITSSVASAHSHVFTISCH